MIVKCTTQNNMIPKCTNGRKWREISDKKAVIFLRKKLFCPVSISLHFQPFVVCYGFSKIIWFQSAQNAALCRGCEQNCDTSDAICCLEHVLSELLCGKNETREDNVLVLSKFVTKQAYCLFAGFFSFFSSEKRVILIYVHNTLTLTCTYYQSKRLFIAFLGRRYVTKLYEVTFLVIHHFSIV